MDRFEVIPITMVFIIYLFEISEVKYGRSTIEPDYELLGEFKVSNVIRGGSEQSWNLLYS